MAENLFLLTVFLGALSGALALTLLLGEELPRLLRRRRIRARIQATYRDR